MIRPVEDYFIDAYEIKKNRRILAVYDSKIIIYQINEKGSDIVRFFVF